jgi:hypothetical protein
MRNLVRVVVAAVLLSGVIACTSSDDGESSPPMAVSLIQRRSTEGSRTVAVTITNTGDTAFTIESVHLIWAPLPEAPTSPTGTEFPPGRTLDQFTDYGRPDCSGYPSPPVEPPVVELRFAGSEQVVTRPIDAEGRAWLHRLYVAACEKAALHDVARVRFLNNWTRIELEGTPYLRGRLALDRVGSREPITVTSVFGSVLLSFDPMAPSRPVAVLKGDQAALRVPVRIGSSGRCDKHALGGSTQTYLLSVYVRHGDAPVQRLILTPDAPIRARILHVVHDACGI